MNILAKTVVFGGFGLVAAAAGWAINVYQSTGTQSEIYSIKLVPQGSSGTLKVDKPNQCKKNKHDGCLLFEEDMVGLMKFHLPGAKDKRQKCDKAKNVITRIELATTVLPSTPTQPNTNREKGDFNDSPLDPWIKASAFQGVNLNTGVVYEEALENAETQAWIVNMNSHKAAEGEKEFWYKVTVESCDGKSGPWVTDPRGDNKGLK